MPNLYLWTLLNVKIAINKKYTMIASKMAKAEYPILNRVCTLDLEAVESNDTSQESMKSASGMRLSILVRYYI